MNIPKHIIESLLVESSTFRNHVIALLVGHQSIRDEVQISS
jgi:hypothetical protein